ncbi:MAG: hypothetical protein AVDCRST_MAG07-1800, partial [uncultured Frankineae bacterium]
CASCPAGPPRCWWSSTTSIRCGRCTTPSRPRHRPAWSTWCPRHARSWSSATPPARRWPPWRTRCGAPPCGPAGAAADRWSRCRSSTTATTWRPPRRPSARPPTRSSPGTRGRPGRWPSAASRRASATSPPPTGPTRSPGDRSPARACRPAPSRSRGRTPASTRGRPPAAGSSSGAPRWRCSTSTASRPRCSPPAPACASSTSAR